LGRLGEPSAAAWLNPFEDSGVNPALLASRGELAPSVAVPDPALALSRDAQRKDELRRLRAALQAYNQAHGRFPCTIGDSWLWSVTGPSWLKDNAEGCAGESSFDLEHELMSPLPVDPINTDPANNTVAFWQPGGYVYGYRGSLQRCPAAKNGHYFVIGARLENESDPDGTVKVSECDGTPLAWPDGVFALTSEEEH
jgi:hypothetical protein